jgi:hypothetical protein
MGGMQIKKGKKKEKGRIKECKKEKTKPKREHGHTPWSPGIRQGEGNKGRT